MHKIPKLRDVGVDKDECIFTWDAEKPNEIEAFHYNESHHNSNAYDKQTEVIQLDDETVEKIKDIVVKLAENRAYEDEMKKEDKLREEQVARRIEKAMQYGTGARFVSLQSDKRIWGSERLGDI
jgi:hypothetical protein